MKQHKTPHKLKKVDSSNFQDEKVSNADIQRAISSYDPSASEDSPVDFQQSLLGNGKKGKGFFANVKSLFLTIVTAPVSLYHIVAKELDDTFGISPTQLLAYASYLCTSGLCTPRILEALKVSGVVVKVGDVAEKKMYGEDSFQKGGCDCQGGNGSNSSSKSIPNDSRSTGDYRGSKSGFAPLLQSPNASNSGVPTF